MSHPAIRVAFDRQIFRVQRRGGISRYFMELSEHLSHRSDLEIRHWSRWNPHWADVVHASFYLGRPHQLRPGHALVSSLFDMTPERHPEHFFLPSLRSPHANKAAWLEAADLILSISAASADDLAFFLPGLRTPVRVIHLGTAMDTLLPLPIPQLQGRRFWLLVGKRHAYKNGLTLLRALARLTRSHAAPILVCAGGGGWRAEERRWIQSHQLGDRLLQRPVSDGELAWLYRRAEVVLIPSIAEGFSLPVIEALVCNTPVIASDLEVHREVGGRFATLLPALNANAWREVLAAASITPLPRPRDVLGATPYNELCRYYACSRMIDQHAQAYCELAASSTARLAEGVSPSRQPAVRDGHGKRSEQR